ncbi:cell division protein CrgA [Nocardioides immobilis]|uniref:Cell division protein CrgA n=2 Tax=Nocardioides immobilis TaxID=2049295 RepID=A0A417Y0A1_9ACTN|nr:cell division protein CrgA [Nocardioides immobilis]
MFSIRFLVSLVLMLGGIAWMAYYYIGVRPVAGFGDDDKPLFDLDAGKEGVVTGWQLMGDLQEWNYLIGFGAIMLGLMIAAHPSTPLGRGRGVVVGMLGCFVLGLLWICTYYVVGTGDHAQDLAVFNDLEQKNLFVGIAFMAVGFTFATKWE